MSKKDPDLDKIHEEAMRMAVMERSGALQRGVALSEITGRGRYDVSAGLETGADHSGPSGAWKVEIHHILGRGIPEGYNKAPEIVKEFWPHIPPGCILLTTAEHRHVEKNSRMMRPLLLNWILLIYLEEEWQGEPYWKWLSEPPFAQHLP